MFSSLSIWVDLLMLASVGNCLLDIVKAGKIFKSKTEPEIISEYYVREYQKNIQHEDYVNADASIAKACDVAPSMIIPWAIRAVCVEAHFPERKKTDEYLIKATENMKLKKPTDEELAWYEYCKGCVCIGRSKISQGISHIKRSVELKFDANRKQYLDYLQENFKQPARCQGQNN